ncbi:zinc ribbon domain-containing protein [Burkholderia cenocepacia]|uniref:FmdB family zinc ribbon protein n=1 Tax=Burkholderia cenocepacia TaxID=95486 RepID=UPI002D1FBD9A|nr:zinc ribbon domain-containing protein [Burkholderia cenocepacia]
MTSGSARRDADGLSRGASSARSDDHDMPMYEYACPGCGVFDARRMVSERDIPACCPRCGQHAPRVRLTLPSIYRSNHDASHEGDDGAYLKSRFGCACCRS